jgi:hypothetical protein
LLIFQSSFLLSRHAWRLHAVSGFRRLFNSGQRNFFHRTKPFRLAGDPEQVIADSGFFASHSSAD